MCKSSFSSVVIKAYIYETNNFIKSFFITCIQKYENIYIQDSLLYIDLKISI